MGHSVFTASVSNISSIFNFEDLKRDFPFNIKVLTKQSAKIDVNFFGPGIYSIFDNTDNIMIYIGIYTPSGSVIDKRYRKHLQTLTLRGSEVTFKSSLQRNHFLSKIKNERLVQDLIGCDSFDERLVKDRCVSHINKVNYAASNWREFGIWAPSHKSTSAFESRFCFQFDKINGGNVNKSMLQNIEKRLISCFNPLTNSSYNPTIKPKYVSQIQLSEFIKDAIALKYS